MIHHYRNYRVYILVAFCWLICGCGNGQNAHNNNASSNTTSNTHSLENITLVNWNVEWFGSTKNGPKDLDLQQDNVVKILNYLHASLYGLCEIVDVDRLSKVVSQLGENYDFVISDYAAGVRNRNSSNWADAQKMAFVFDKTIFSNVRCRAFMQKSGRAGYNFSNGRYPFLLEATISQKGKAVPIAILLIHAKAGSDNNSYSRRLQAANELSDSIHIHIGKKPLIMMGDFNDVLQNSIAGKNMVTPYSALLQNGNIALTSKLSPASGGSTLDYATVIDQQIVNTALYTYYVKGSISIRKDIVNTIRDYKNGKTSDHYPVSSSYNLTQAKSTTEEEPANSVTTKESPTINSDANDVSLQLVSSSFKDAIEIKVLEKQQNVQFVLYNTTNEKVLSVHKKSSDVGRSFYLRCKELTSGNYTLVVFCNGRKKVFEVNKL